LYIPESTRVRRQRRIITQRWRSERETASNCDYEWQIDEGFRKVTIYLDAKQFANCSRHSQAASFNEGETAVSRGAHCRAYSRKKRLQFRSGAPANLTNLRFIRSAFIRSVANATRVKSCRALTKQSDLIKSASHSRGTLDRSSTSVRERFDRYSLLRPIETCQSGCFVHGR